MPQDYMAHERMRWSTMTEDQLLVRLGRIKNSEKLAAFIELCIENGSEYLLVAASHRAGQLAIGYLMRRCSEYVDERTPQRRNPDLVGEAWSDSAHARVRVLARSRKQKVEPKAPTVRKIRFRGRVV